MFGLFENNRGIILSCYYNPENNPYRKKNFDIFYERIKEYDHKIIECSINGSAYELSENDNIVRTSTNSLAWHKETLLNSLIEGLPRKYKYVHWIDADVMFLNERWFKEANKELRTSHIIQPFSKAYYLERDQLKIKGGEFSMNSCCYNFVENPKKAKSEVYEEHGHVGFAWAAKRELIVKVGLYDKALIGGADHILFHAAAGQINHNCIMNTFGKDTEIEKWSKAAYKLFAANIGYVEGELYHLWHGDLKKRQYYKRVKEFAPIQQDTYRDSNGFHVLKKPEAKRYIDDYYRRREDTSIIEDIVPSLINLAMNSGGGVSHYDPLESESRQNLIRESVREADEFEQNIIREKTDEAIRDIEIPTFGQNSEEQNDSDNSDSDADKLFS